MQVKPRYTQFHNNCPNCNHYIPLTPEEAYSQHHREVLGIECPCADFDLVMMEQSYDKPVAICEIKRMTEYLKIYPYARNNNSIRGLNVLADNTRIPNILIGIVRDRGEFGYRFRAMNSYAEEILSRNNITDPMKLYHDVEYVMLQNQLRKLTY